MTAGLRRPLVAHATRTREALGTTIAAIVPVITTEVEAPHQKGPDRVDRNTCSEGRKWQRGGSSSSSSGKPSSQPATDLPQSVSPASRQVKCRLADVSGQILGLSTNERADRPLSFTSAHNFAAVAADQEQPTAREAAAAAQAESARVPTIQREYIQMDVKKLWHIKIMLAADKKDPGLLTPALITSLWLTVRNILQLQTPRALNTSKAPLLL